MTGRQSLEMLRQRGPWSDTTSPILVQTNDTLDRFPMFNVVESNAWRIQRSIPDATFQLIFKKPHKLRFLFYLIAILDKNSPNKQKIEKLFVLNNSNVFWKALKAPLFYKAPSPNSHNFLEKRQASSFTNITPSH